MFSRVITTKFAFEIVTPEQLGRKLLETVNGLQNLNCTIKASVDDWAITGNLIKDVGLGNFPLSISGATCTEQAGQSAASTP